MTAIQASGAVVAQWKDVWLLGGARTPFIDYAQALALVSPIDLGIKVARELFASAKVAPADVGSVVAGSVAQASFDAYLLPRHIGLYSGVPVAAPAHLVQRVCGTGIEVISQAADAVALGRAQLVLGVGAESMSRNPIAAYTHRTGFRLGQVEFKDFLWEALIDPAVELTMGGTAERLAKQYKISRPEVDAFAARSFERALAAQKSGFLAGEICELRDEQFSAGDFKPRAIKLPGKDTRLSSDSHVRPSSLEALSKIKPAFGGVQTGGNSSAIVDGAAAVLVGSGEYARRNDHKPFARLLAAATVGVPADIMGIGPCAAISALLAAVHLKLSDIDRIEINEAFGAQVLACVKELGLPENKLNVNGGAIALGHPLGATGVRITWTVARQLQQAGLRYGIASACIGGGQGIAILVENRC